MAKLTSEIEKLSSASDAVGGTIDPKFNLPKQYLEDLGRQKNEFQGRDGKMKTAENLEQTIAMLDKFSGNENAARTYQLRRLSNGNVSLHMEAFNPMVSVGILAQNELKTVAQRPWPSGVTANKDEFDFKCITDIEFDQGELLQGKLKVVGTPVFDYAFNLRPDWDNVL